MTRIGTNHFVSLWAAKQYYRRQGEDRPLTVAREKLALGEIQIGTPEIADDETLYLDTDNRWFIERKERHPEAAGPHPHPRKGVRL